MSDKFIALQGGLDLTTPPLIVKAGAASEALNYFESVRGGYTRVAGYERLDGQLSPHTASYHKITITFWNLRAEPTPLVVGETLTVGTVSFLILALIPTEGGSIMEVVGGEASGTIPDNLYDAPVAYSTNCLITDIVKRGANDEVTDNLYLNYARTSRREAIAPVEGEGPIRGVSQIQGNAIAWRDDTEGKLKAYVSSSTGWNAVKYAQLVVSDVKTNVPIRGDVCNTGTKVILSVFPYLDDSGNPVDTKQILAVHNVDDILLEASNDLTRDTDSTSLASVESLLTYDFTGGGKVRTLLHNFYASAATRYLYFTDGINMAGVYKPEHNCIQPIATNYRLMDDIFSHLIAHNNRLWLSTNYGTALTSVADEPELLDGFLGSVEFGAGDVITGFSHTGADLLHTFTENTVQALRGTSSANYVRYVVSDSVGAVDDSIMDLDDVFSVSKRGITSLKRTDSLGGFDAATVTDKVQDLMYELNQLGVTASLSIKNINQMRVFFGKRLLFLSRVTYNANGNEGVRYGITEGVCLDSITCTDSGDDSEGNERILYGGESGFVYQADVGTSFDGESIESLLTLQPNHLGSPQIRKRFRQVALETTSSNAVDIRMYYSMNEGRKTFSPKQLKLDGGSTGFDEAQYDFSLFDAYPSSRPRASLVGDGHNIQFSFYHLNADVSPFTISGYTLRFSNRGLTP